MPLLASLSAFGYYSGCVDCKLSPVAFDILSVLVSSASVERIFSISRDVSREKKQAVDHARNTFKKEKYLK